jgi:integrase
MFDGATENNMTAGGELHVNYTVEIIEGGTELTRDQKNTHRRDVPINVDLLAVLERRRTEIVKLKGTDIGDYFVVAKPESPLAYYNPGTLQKDWRVFRNVAGLKGVTYKRVYFHDLRHTFATTAIVKNDIDVVTVAGILGHSSPRVTLDFYARWLPNANREAMTKMEGILPEIDQEKTEQDNNEQDKMTANSI